MKHFILLVLLMLASGRCLAGGHCRCDRCGCECPCREVCRLVCEMKEVKEVCYSCKCESFCVPGRSTKCGEKCECDPCKHGTGCGFVDCLLGQYHGESCRSVWNPTCEADLYHRNKLFKTEVTRKVPTYKWVVEKCCDRCEHAVATSPATAAAGTIGPSPAGAPPSTPSTFEMAESPKLPWSPFFK